MILILFLQWAYEPADCTAKEHSSCESCEKTHQTG
jgi:hypothetical protein